MKVTPQLNVHRSRLVLQAEDSSWMRMKIASVLLATHLMRMVIVYHVQVNLGSLSTPKAAACAIAHAASSSILWPEDVSVLQGTNSIHKESVLKVS